MAGHLRSEVRAWPLRVEVDDRHVAELLGPIHERVQQDGGRGCRAMEVHVVARADDRRGLCGGDDAHRLSLPSERGGGAMAGGGGSDGHPARAHGVIRTYPAATRYATTGPWPPPNYLGRFPAPSSSG